MDPKQFLNPEALASFQANERADHTLRLAREMLPEILSVVLDISDKHVDAGEDRGETITAALHALGWGTAIAIVAGSTRQNADGTPQMEASAEAIGDALKQMAVETASEPTPFVELLKLRPLGEKSLRDRFLGQVSTLLEAQTKAIRHLANKRG